MTNAPSSLLFLCLDEIRKKGNPELSAAARFEWRCRRKWAISVTHRCGWYRVILEKRALKMQHQTFWHGFFILALLLFQFGSASAEAGTVLDRKTGKWVETNENISTAVRKRLNASPIPRVVVSLQSGYPSGTLLIKTREKYLYRIMSASSAERYGIGVGREGFAWQGRERVSRKSEWPRWVPPLEMRKREALAGRDLPAMMEGGPENPLGARALYLGQTLFRIHGTNQPWTIGQAVSSGCIRLANDDIIHLFNQTKVGDLVIVE